MTSDEVKQEYLSFNFDSNTEFQNYLRTLDPIPEGKLLEKKKRIWFRNKINPSFDVFFDADEKPTTINEEPNTQKSAESNAENSSEKPSFTPPPNMNKPMPNFNASEKVKEEIYNMEGYLKLGFFVAVLIPMVPKNLAQVAGFIACLLGLVRQNLSVSLSKAYFLKLISNEFLLNLLYIGTVWMLDNKQSVFFMLPVAMYLLLGAAEFLTRNTAKFGIIMSRPQFSNLINIIKGSRATIMECKYQMELFILAYLLVLVILKQSSPFNFALYVVTFIFKFTQSPILQKVIIDLRGLIKP